MKTAYIFCLFLILSFVDCRKRNNSQAGGSTAIQTVSVFTQHNDNYRTGWNSRESILTTTNVNSSHFGKLFSLIADDHVYAQPLVVSDLGIGGGKHNVVFIATVNNTIYAYDGDNGDLYWKKNYTASGMRPPKNSDMTGACGGGYQDFSGNIGIVGTPVIDSTAQTMYFVSRSTDGTNYLQHLHAINIINGSEMNGSPALITATCSGSGDGSVANTITFDTQKQNQRQALTLVNGIVYISWSSHCDWGPYHGWIIGYDSKTLQQKIVYNDTPDGGDGGIWESGMGLCADNAGKLYASIGNGTVGAGGDPTNVRNRSESAMQLSESGSTLVVNTYFTPYTYGYLNANDLDFGSIGSLLIPNSNFYFTGDKNATIYLLNKDNMGGYQLSTNNVQQTISLNNANANEHCQACYYKGSSKEFVYLWSENDKCRAFPFNRSTNMFDVSNTIYSAVSGPTGQTGAMLSVSSNGNTSGTGILWASYAKTGNDAEHTVSPGILRALNADNISQELWNSTMVSGDEVGNFAKFSSPTIANGHVYLATFSNTVVVYGLK